MACHSPTTVGEEKTFFLPANCVPRFALIVNVNIRQGGTEFTYVGVRFIR